MLQRYSRTFRPFYRATRLFATAVNEEQAVAEPNEDLQKDFGDFMSDLVEQTKDVHAQDVGRLRRLTSSTFGGLKNEFEKRPPANEYDINVFLDKLSSLLKADPNIPYVEWLESESVVSSLNAKLLNPTASPNAVISCLASILALYNPRSATPTAEDRLVPDLSSAISELMKQVHIYIVESPGALEVKPLLSLALALKTSQFQLDGTGRQELLAILPRKLDDISAPYLLLQLFEVDEIVNDPILRDKIDGKVDELLPILNAGELVSLFGAFAKTGYRNLKLMQRMAEAIRLRGTLSANQCGRLLMSMEVLSFYHARLLKFIENQVVQSLHQLVRYNAFSTILFNVSKMRINNPNLWFCLSQWANNNVHKAPIAELSMAISSFAIGNVPADLIRPSATRLAEVLKPNKVKSPVVWLNSVHSLAILDCLPARMAETLLDPTFLSDLSKNCNEVLRLHRFIKVLQVASYLKYDLNQAVNLPEDLLNLIQSKPESMVSDLRHRKNVQTEKLDFMKNLNIIVPRESHLLEAQIEPNTGAYVDGIVYLNKTTKRFLPVTKLDEKNPDLEKIAIIFATHNLLTTPDLDDLKPTRVIGEVAMNYRHLRKAGFRPVLIRKHDLNQFLDNMEETRFIRHLLLEDTTVSLTPDISVFERED